MAATVNSQNSVAQETIANSLLMWPRVYRNDRLSYSIELSRRWLTKKMLKTISLIGLVMLSAAGFARAQSGGDAEFARLNGDLSQSYAAGDYEKALAAAEKLLAMATRLDGKDSFSVGKVLRNRGM